MKDPNAEYMTGPDIAERTGRRLDWVRKQIRTRAELRKESGK